MNRTEGLLSPKIPASADAASQYGKISVKTHEIPL
jgi:hypothetical protein